MFAILGLLLVLWIACIILGALIKAVGWLIIVGLIGIVATALIGAFKGLAGKHR